MCHEAENVYRQEYKNAYKHINNRGFHMLKNYNLSYLEKTLIYFSAFCFLLNIGCVYTHIEGIFQFGSIVAFLPIISLTFLIFIKKRFARSNFQKAIKSVFALAVYLSIYALISDSKILSLGIYILFICVLVAYFILIERNSAPYILIAYRNIIFVLSFFSLIMWLLGSVLNLIPSSAILVDWGGPKSVNSYFMLHFDSETITFWGFKFICNRSIFVERAFAAFAFIIGFAYEIFVEKDKSFVRTVVLLLSIISTFSLTGLIILIFALALKYIYTKEKVTMLRFAKYMTIPVVVICAISIMQDLFDMKMEQGLSGTSRISDFINGFNAWYESPWFGYGYGNQDMIMERFHTGYSNSLSMILTRGGLMISILYLIAIFNGIKNRISQKDITGALFVIVIVGYFIFTAIAFTDIMTYLIVYFAYSCQRSYSNLNEVRTRHSLSIARL